MDWDNTTFPTGHTSDAGKAIDIAQIIADKAMELGAEFRFNTPGVQLVQDESGRVTGIIGESKDGYVQFNAAKGVILATGDYASDYDMCADLCPWVVGTHNYYNPNYNTGDGHKMGVWVGAKMCIRDSSLSVRAMRARACSSSSPLRRMTRATRSSMGALTNSRTRPGCSARMESTQRPTMTHGPSVVRERTRSISAVWICWASG